MGRRENELGQAKYFANRGLARNKAPIANLIYRVEVRQLKSASNPVDYTQYMFKGLGYLVLYWTNRKADTNGEFYWYYHGLITPGFLKQCIGEKQYSKFCQGKREFIIQRRVDGKNTPPRENQSTL